VINFTRFCLLSLSQYSVFFVDGDSSVGVVTRYGLDGPGMDPGGDEIFHTISDRSWGPLSLLYNGYRVFSGVKTAGTWR
jgi:hypothetical protein